MRKKTVLPSDNLSPEKIISWCRRFDDFVVLNSNNNKQLQEDPYGEYDLLIGAGNGGKNLSGNDPFAEIKKHFEAKPDWLFGYFSYELKNNIEKLSSKNPERVHNKEYYFFIPRYVFEFSRNKYFVHYLEELDDESSVSNLLQDILTETSNSPESNSIIEINSRVSRDEYLETIKKILHHIQRGDIYELNYCIEFFSQNATVIPYSVYRQMNEISPMPFSVFAKFNSIWLMCASPERYLAKRGDKIISQPIKGTARRGNSASEDKEIIEAFRHDKKEQSENVMIVDMVRNDLSRTASRASVKVEELFGVKTFKQLHQMISTVTSNLNDNFHFTDVIRNSFPMGSMTGAPKIRAMELIDEFEISRRGVYSGAVGYIRPDQNFDFNVVIRSILFNSENNYLSFMAGSAITAASVAEKEYEECLLKAEGMRRVLTQVK